MSPSKLSAPLNSNKHEYRSIGANDDRPIKGMRWHQFHLWVGSRDFKFLEQLAREQEESIAHIIRRLIRQLRMDAERSRQ
jgi:hypothetical protein